MQKIFIGGGCFWGVQAYFNQIKGVISTRVGYLNGGQTGVTYKQVINNSGHVEVVEIKYNNQLNHKELFQAFIKIVDPFSLNRQGNDVGIQYRIGLYYTNSQQQHDLTKLLKAWGKNQPHHYIELKLATDFTVAETYHQDYLQKNPHGYCHIDLTTIDDELKK